MRKFFWKIVLVALFAFPLLLCEIPAAKAQSVAVQVSPTGGPAVDRLSWLAGLISTLQKEPSPPCVGPRGCKVDIPEDSPCRKPPKKRPDVVIDGVLPGGAPGTWTVGYRLMCSECYLGGTAALALVRVDKQGAVRILDTVTLPKYESSEIPSPVEMTSEDVDEDGRVEMTVCCRNDVEKKHKCMGLQDSSSYIFVFRPDGRRLTEVLREPLSIRPVGKGETTVARYHFNDENNDGYPDAVLTRTRRGKADDCQKKGTACMTEQTVFRYVEEKGDWSAVPFSGLTLGDGVAVDCDVPLPETPFVTVTETLTGKRVTPAMESKARAVREKGFARACLYDGARFPGLLEGRFYVISSAHDTRAEADDEAAALRRTGFRPFVKELFH